MDDTGFLSATEFTIPVGQIIFYMLFSTFCFLFRKYKLGLMISFAFVFNWGFIHSSVNFIDMVGRPTLGLFVYLISGILITVLALVGFFHEEPYTNNPVH